ncbi:GNAT family N-acetyltransferase [Cytobacillus purgationiresistens]|uniref:GNAT family acetyltransferase n=1 Tax=Cytobacillus purgationiresistens TaxID=863449 RepID=A0ABU0AKY2_9BACI|nr:GNAT family N-acetyltransferase [Cytobacillus purgationiresistens]MDQ0271907.1 putative GNAT family acetyltransferase [Cytobacillus purgationiresistens]
MNIQKEEGRHFIQDDLGNSVAEISYSQNDDQTITIDHTFVDEDYRGQGAARRLVDSVVEEMKQQNKKIIPACKFAAAVFKRVPEYQSQLAK